MNKEIVPKCTDCGSWNIIIVHSVFSYYLCEDCGACYQEHTMIPLKGVYLKFHYRGKDYTKILSIDELKSINRYEDLNKILKDEL